MDNSFAFWTSLVGQWIRNCLPVQGTLGCGFDPWSKKIPHVAEQLSSCATTTEAKACALKQEKPLQ